MMNHVSMAFNTSCLQQLREQVRFALKPASPTLIKQWLKFENGEQQDLLAKQENLNDQFYLLLDAVGDDYLPIQWRKHCLKEIFKPLFMLKELEESLHNSQIINNDLKQHNNALFDELKQTHAYFEQSLGGQSCNCGKH